MFQKIKNNRLLIYSAILFIFVFLFSILIPLGGDDWGNYLCKEKSLGEVLNIAKDFYLSFEGRFFSRIAVSTIIPHPLIWALLNSLLVSLLFYMLAKILTLENKNYLLLLMGALVFLDAETFAQIYVWRTGNVTYFIPTLFAIFLIYRRRKLFTDEEVKTSKFDYVLIPFSLIFSMFIENVAVAIVMICLLNTVFYYIRYKKIDKAMLLSFIFSSIGLLLMVLSPGTKMRLSTVGEFADFSIFEKIVYNLPNLINYTFIKNSFLVILMTLVVVYIIHKFVKQKPIKWGLFAFMGFVPLFTAVINFVNNLYNNIPSVLTIVLDETRWYICLYWVIYTILFLFLIFYFLKDLNKKVIIYFIILAMASNGAMLVSPLWGGRTACFTTLMLYACVIMLIKHLDIFKSKKFFVVENIAVFGFIIIFICYSIYIFNLNIDRNKYINYQIQHDYEKYEIVILPGYWVWNLNTWGSDGYFAHAFKKTYGIPLDAELIYVKKKDAKKNIDKLNVSSKMKY